MRPSLLLPLLPLLLALAPLGPAPVTAAAGAAGGSGRGVAAGGAAGGTGAAGAGTAGAGAGGAPPAPLQLRLDAATAPPFPEAAAFFAAGPQGFAYNGSLAPPLLADLRRLGVPELLGWDGIGGAARTEPLTDTVTTVRVLGGWKPKHGQPAGWSDIAYRVADGGLGYRWELLWSRLDPLVNSSIRPIVVLDNVDYAFVRNASEGKYGQSLAPDDLHEYGGFIAELVKRTVQRYSRQTVEKFWWRVATEPNTGRGGTGQDVPAPDAEKIEVYANYYVAVCAAVHAVLPGAVVGPGNFASWWQMGMACNSTTGKHANQGLNLIEPMLTSILQKGGTVGFLAASFYAANGGKEVGTNTSCTQCGYDPRQARAAGEGLRYLRGIAPPLAAVPLQVQEYAAVGSGQHGISFEPGAFGGAWTLASCIEFAALGIDRVFHWNIGAGNGGYDTRQSVDAAGHMLWFGNAWVMAAALKLFGPSPAAKVSVMVAHRKQDTLARHTEGNGGVCTNTTTASGIGGPLPHGTGVGLLLSVLSPRKDCSDPVEVSIAFEFAEDERAPGLQVMVLNRSTSVYDQIHRHAARNEGWLNYDDGEVYQLGTMLTPAGLAGVKALAPHWLAQQAAAFTPRDLDAQDGVSVACAGGSCTLSLIASPPSTYAVWVGR
jgi:hypothetical protein